MIGRWRKKRRLQDNSEPIVLEGLAKSAGGQGRTRILMTMAVFFAIYGVIAGRLVWFGTQELEQGGPGPSRVTASRPDIVDRHGQVLATDINTSSLFAEPRRIVDADEALEKLLTVLPDLNVEQTYNRLQSDAGFMWLRRQLTPRQEQAIMQLGIPGIGFRSEKRRFYPGGPTAAHIVGLVNVDNKGIAGMEKYVDDQGLADLQASGLAVARDLEPVRLSIDLRVQHIVRDELERAMERYKAIAAGALVLDARTGEVLAMASLPDFDPNNPYNAHEKDRLNRMSAGVYEMGSSFKGFTVAMALEKGTATLDSRFDATRPIQIARHTIRDFYGKGRVLTVPEVFIYSSNIGTARMAETVSVPEHREFFRKIGLLDRMKTELPEVARPTEPAEWKRINQVTISFGHGVATTPLQTAMSGAAMLNGGKLMQPTFLPRTEEEANLVAEQVIRPEVSKMMRYLFRLNVEKGSGRRAEVPGYFVGGKTGTAEKVVNGRYVSGKRFNTFLAGFPVNDPEYIVLAVLDEPQPEKPGGGATAGINTTQMVAAIVRRSAAMLGVKPDFGHESQALLVSSN